MFKQATLLMLIGTPVFGVTYSSLNFESDDVGTQPTGSFEFSPGSNSAENGTVIIDAGSTPANPLPGKSVYVYDQSSSPTHWRWDFAGGNNVANLRVAFDFQRTYETIDDDDTGVKIGLAPAGTLPNNSDFRPFEIRLLNDSRVRVNDVNGTGTAGNFLTDAANSMVILLNGDDVASLPFDYEDVGSGTLAPNSMQLFLNGTLLGEYTFYQTPDPTNAPQIDFYAQAEDVGRIGFYQDSNRQGGFAFDNIVVESIEESGNGGGEEDIYYQNTFEEETTGAQPTGPFTLSPKDNTSTNGFVIVDAASTPANPLPGKALYIYDLSGNLSSGEPTHLRWDFNEGQNVSNLRVEFDFQRMYAVDSGDEDTRVHFGVSRAGEETNNSDFRPFEVRFMNSGGIWIQSADGSSQATTYDTDNRNHVVILMNSHDTLSAPYDDGVLGSGTLAPNSMLFFLNNTEIGTYSFFQTPDPTNAPQIDFYAQDNDLGRVGFYQDSKRQGGIVFDNLVIASMGFEGLAPPAAPSSLAAQAVSYSEVHLTWTDNSDNETGFVIERKDGEGSFQTVGEVGENATSYDDEELDGNTDYVYRVFATNGTFSDPSNEASVHTPEQLLPAIESQSESRTFISGRSLTLSVTASGAEPLSYQWYSGDSGVTTSPIAEATASTFETGTLTTHAKYWVRVSNGNGSADSETIELTVYQPVTRTASSISAFNSAMAASQPGDIVEIPAGEYLDWVLEVEGIGNADAPITVRAQSPGHTILKGKSRMEISGDYLVVSGLAFVGEYSGNDDEVIQFRGDLGPATNCRLTEVGMYDYIPADLERTFWVGLYGQNNRVDHCLFRGHDCNGVTIVVWLDGQPNDHRIDHNHFHDRKAGDENGWETIRIGTSDTSMSTSRSLVEYNLFSYVDGEIEAISNKSGGNIYRGNTFYASQGMLTLRHGNNCLVEGNFFIGANRSETGGVRIIGENHRVVNNYFEGTTGRDGAAITIYAGVPNSPLNEYFAAHNALVAFNTFNSVQGDYISYGTGYGTRERTILPTGVQIAYNVLDAGNFTTGSFVTGTQPELATYTGNLAFGRTLGVSESGWTLSDPLLSPDVASGFSRPDSGSPAIDALNSIQFGVESDIDGQMRDAAPDLGADEVSSGSANALIGPLTVDDTGPGWAGEGRYTPITGPSGWIEGASQTSDQANFHSDWFGDFSMRYWPWVYHFDHGWIFGVDGDANQVIYYDTDLGWNYTHPSLYPWIYNYSEGDWKYYYPGSGSPRWFFSHNGENWISVD